MSANRFERLVVFGDSFMDTGNFSAVTAVHGATWPARSGTNPEPMWIELVAHALGHAANPSTIGGTNHAEAYALAAGVMDPIPGLEHLGLQPTPVVTQVEHVIANRHVGADDLVIINGGGNDALLSVLSGVGAPMIDAAADAFSASVTRLAEVAADVIVIGTPDLGLSPMAGAGAGGADNPISAAVRSYTAAVTTRLPLAWPNVRTIDGYGLFGHLVADPGAWGLDDVTSPSYRDAGIDAFLKGPADQVSADVSRYLFSDAIHISATGHRLFAAYALGRIEALL
jgi:outer membrane lipase/esterase